MPRTCAWSCPGWTRATLAAPAAIRIRCYGKVSLEARLCDKWAHVPVRFFAADMTQKARYSVARARSRHCTSPLCMAGKSCTQRALTEDHIPQPLVRSGLEAKRRRQVQGYGHAIAESRWRRECDHDRESGEGPARERERAGQQCDRAAGCVPHLVRPVGDTAAWQSFSAIRARVR